MNPSFRDTLGDLIILVPDGDIEAALQSLLAHHQRLRIQPIRSKIYKHPQRNAGVRTKAYDLMRLFCRQFRFGLVFLDWEGSGANETPRQLEEQMDQQLEANGWNRGRAKIIVIHPELEVWVWSLVQRLFQEHWDGEAMISLSGWLLKEFGIKMK